MRESKEPGEWGEIKGKYKFPLPCQLGEKFISLKFVDWEDDKRFYKEGEELMLKGFEKSLFDIVCYGYKNGVPKDFLSYGEFGVGYEAACSVWIDMCYFEKRKLSEWGFPSDRTGKLIGLCVEDECELAHFCIEPRYEHVYYPIKKIQYDLFDNAVVYDKKADKERLSKKKIQETVPHREGKITLSEDEQDEIIKRIISDSAKVNLKLRKNDIDKNKIRANYHGNGDYKILYVIDLDNLGKRAKGLSKKNLLGNMSIINEKLFIFYIK